MNGLQVLRLRFPYRQYAPPEICQREEVDSRRIESLPRIVRKRKIIVYTATSPDGFIARPDGSIDWLKFPPPR